MAFAPNRPLFGGPVQFDHRVVDGDLVLGLQAADCLEDFSVDRLDGPGDTLAQVPVPAIAQFNRFVGAGRRARRDCRAATGPILQQNVDLDGRVAAAVKDFAADDIDNGGHLGVLCG